MDWDLRKCGITPQAELEHELATRPAFPRAWLIPGTNISFPHVNVTRWDEWQDCFLLTAEPHKASPWQERGEELNPSAQLQAQNEPMDVELETTSAPTTSQSERKEREAKAARQQLQERL